MGPFLTIISMIGIDCKLFIDLLTHRNKERNNLYQFDKYWQKSNFVQEFVLDVCYCVNVNPSTHSLIEVVVQVFRNDQITKKTMLII